MGNGDSHSHAIPYRGPNRQAGRRFAAKLDCFMPQKLFDIA
jgi:hypothetical protein